MSVGLNSVIRYPKIAINPGQALSVEKSPSRLVRHSPFKTEQCRLLDEPSKEVNNVLASILWGKNREI
jgi:hypothetical protein